MDDAYGRTYADLYRRHWWWRAREALILEVLAELRPGGGWGTVLDIGCGDGLLFDRLSSLGEVEGVEPDAGLVSANGPWRHRIHVRAFDESFDTGRRFGLIVMLDVLEHLLDPVGALRHARSLLAPGGRMVLTVPAFRLLWTRHDEINHHVTRYTRAHLVHQARRAGLNVEHARYFFHWLFPAKLAVRATEHLLGAGDTLPSVPPEWINAAAYRLSRLEQAVVKPLRLPFGTSLLAVLSAPTSPPMAA